MTREERIKLEAAVVQLRTAGGALVRAAATLKVIGVEWRATREHVDGLREDLRTIAQPLKDALAAEPVEEESLEMGRDRGRRRA